MKRLLAATALLAYICLMAGLFSCVFMPNSFSKCERTEKPHIDVSIKATVHVIDADKQPIADQELRISLYKIPCEKDATGHVLFEGPTNEQGTRETTVAYYNLRNSEDEVWVDVYAINLGNGTATKDSEYASYKYDDFVPGSTKEVHVYIYRNF